MTKSRWLHTSVHGAFIVTGLLVSACTTRNWYEGAQMSAQEACNRLEPAAREECRAKVSKTRYDEYEKERNRVRP